MKRSALVGVKLAVSAALLAYLFSSTDTRALEQRVRSADLLMLVAAVFCYVAMLALATWRWRLLLETLGVDAPLRRLTSSYLVATFFNNFLPEQHRRRRRAGARRLAPHRLHHRLARRGRHRPHPRLRRALRAGRRRLRARRQRRARAGRGPRRARRAWRCCSWRSPTSSSARHRPRAAGGLAARPLPLAARAVRDRAGRRAHATARASAPSCSPSPPASRSRRSRSGTTSSIARALRIPLPVSAAFLMVPLCTLLQAVPISFNGWGLREGLFTVYFAQVGLPRDSALAFSLVGAGLMVLLSLSGAVAWLARRRPAARAVRGRLTRDGRPGAPRLRQVRSARARASTASRACSRGGSRATTARASTSLARAGSSGPSRRPSGSASRASRCTTSGAAASIPRILSDLVSLVRARGARILHVHGYAAADFGRLAARATGARLVLHEHFADPRMPALPGARRPPAALLHPRRHRRERLDARFPGAGALRAERARAPDLERRAARRVRPGSPRAGARACAAASGFPSEAVVFGTIGRLSAQKGHTLPARGRGPRADEPAAGPLAGRGRRRPRLGSCAPQAQRPRHRRPDASSPGTAPTCPTCWASSTCSASPRSTRARRSPSSRPWPRARRSSRRPSTAAARC